MMEAVEECSDSKSVAAPVKSAVDKLELLPEFLKVSGLVKNHLQSFNYFVETGIKNIVCAKGRIVSDVDPSVYIRFKDVKVGEPSINPYTCRLSDLTYSAPILVDIEHSFGKDKKKKCDVSIGRMPIMLRTCKCVLNDRDEAELAKLGECPLDPGGYFIIKGSEKVILIQEELSKNRIIIDTDGMGNIIASVNCSKELKNKTVVSMENGKFFIEQDVLSRKLKVPIMVALKAMGMESDQEVVQMVGNDFRLGLLLLPSIEDCISCGVSNKEQALEYLRRKGQTSPAVLRDTFLANIPDHEDNSYRKCLYLGVMLRMIMEVSLNRYAVDDKDYIGNKRFLLSGELISLLFEDLFDAMIKEVKKRIDHALKSSKRPSGASNFDASTFLQGYTITTGLERTLSTGNYNIKRYGLHVKGMTQVLSRLSFIGMLSHLTRIAPQFEKSGKVSGSRALQPSQWGMLCPCDTPVGEACGQVKHLALLTHVTTDEKEDGLIKLCLTLGVEDFTWLTTAELHTLNSYLVMLNGLILGKHRKPQTFAAVLRKLRRIGKIGEFTSIFVHDKQKCIYIASDGGRVCRPLVIAEKGTSRIKDHHMKELLDGGRMLKDFLHEGLIEYLDVNEEKNAMIALYEDEAKPETTHIEINPFSILGICAGLIPYPHHNQSPSNTYQCAMGKQAMGNIAYNQLCRMDTLLHLLVYPQRPLLTTRTIELVGYDKLAAGQNAIVAVMSYSGYDLEDAIVMNKSSLDRGFGRCIVIKRHSAIIKMYENGASDRIFKPTKPGSENMQILDDDGLAVPGEIIRPSDIYVNKECPIFTREPTCSRSEIEYKRAPQKFSGPEEESCVVDRVALFSDGHNNLCIKTLIRHTRRPELGDKFSSRHGQKGVCGSIVQQEDFPFSERGICPDLIINPHGFLSRMTVGQMIELLGSKAGVSGGRFHYGDAFEEPSVHADRVGALSETLVRHGFSYNGKDLLYSGITGCPLQAYIFMGPIYYQKLKHMVLDRMHARGHGVRDSLTRQPMKSGPHYGGSRVGEMERDCLIAYGGSMVIFERLMLSSDPFEVLVCRNCGLLAYYSHKLKTEICSACRSRDNASTIKMPYACKLLVQELQSMNVVPRFKLAEA